MHTIRTTINLDADLVERAMKLVPDKTRTAVLEEGLRALIAREASRRLIALGGTAPKARAPKRIAR